MTYVKKTWVNKPNTTTPIMADDLNHIEQGIYDNDQAIATKATLSDIQDNLVNVSKEVDEDYRVNFIKGKNLYNKETDTLNKVLGGDGSETTTTGFCVSDYIAVKPNTQYTISRVLNSGGEDNMRVGYYNNSKTFIERITSTSRPYTFTTPSNCYYIKLSYQFSGNTNVQLEEGTTATTYVAYTPPSIVVDNDEIYKKASNYGTAKLSLTQSETSTVNYQLKKINLSNLNLNGNLSISSGGIKIGSGISKIKVNANMSIATGVVNHKYGLSIFKNSTGVISTYTTRQSNNANLPQGVVIPNFFIDVSENDIIYLYAYIDINGDTITILNDTFLSIEEVS